MTEPRTPPLLLAFAFRPFFLLAALWAAVSLAMWIAALNGLPVPMQVDAAWHAHELLFGVVAAAATGFVLTAVATWTGTPPIAGRVLLALILLWIAGRLVLLVPGLPTGLVASVNVLFLPAVAVALLSRLVPAGNRRNYPLALILLLFALAQAAWHLAAAGEPSIAHLAGTEAGMLCVAALISLIGGRITPAFTRNALRRIGGAENVRDRPTLETANVALLVLAVIAVLASAPAVAAGLTLAAAAAAAARMVTWNGLRVLSEPLLWILHLAWLWLVVALLLKGLAGLGLAIAPTLWWHVLGAGAIGTILMGVMTRVCLGHTGRALVLPRGAVALYVLISLAALTRLAAALAPVDLWMPLLVFSGSAWILAWLGFLLIFAPILLSPRPDGRPG